MAPIAAVAVVIGTIASAEGQRANGQMPDFGEPLSGLTQDELARFHAGKEGFNEEEGVADGIGPVFNNTSCLACHSAPSSGGSSDVLSTRIGKMVNGRFDPLLRFGGPTIQTRGIVGEKGFQFKGEEVPRQATIVARRRANPLFGLGLIDAVPDESFHAQAAFQRQFTPEPAGRPNQVVNLQTGSVVVGKFGWKGGRATVFD
ncbi:MAG TPA: hypothetical protein VK993_13550, partial [Chthoniobacterales bacterium]|nr:hypothetical protein [Chthoniobacterales bacterium]